MPLNPIITVVQTIGQPSFILFTDISTGSDIAITQRRIYLKDYKNNPVVPSGTITDYIEWDYADSQINIDVLEKDMALSIFIEWLDIGDIVLYATTARLEGFTLYNETKYYSLTQSQASQNQPPPMIIQDSAYYTNKGILRTEIDNGNQAIVIGSDITTAQAAYDRATFMVLNESKFF
jgi:hypothetical protein